MLTTAETVHDDLAILPANTAREAGAELASAAAVT